MTEVTGEGGSMSGSAESRRKKLFIVVNCADWLFGGKNKMISPGKKQFDLAERRLLETLERVALCRSGMEARLEKVNGVRGEKLEAPEVCHFSQSLDTKRKRTGMRVEEFVSFREDSAL